MEVLHPYAWCGNHSVSMRCTLSKLTNRIELKIFVSCKQFRYTVSKFLTLLQGESLILPYFVPVTTEFERQYRYFTKLHAPISTIIHLRYSQTSRVYSNNPVLHLYISCYVTVNKPVLSYLLLRLLPQW
jgi:hypothetical protein